MSRRFSQLELDRATRLLLSDGRSVNRIAVRRNVIDLERHDVEPTKLTVDGKIEQSKVAYTAFHLKLGPNRPDVLGAERLLRPDDLALVPEGTRPEAVAVVLEISVMATLLSW